MTRRRSIRIFGAGETTFNTRMTGRVKLLQENPDEYFRRFPAPRFSFDRREPTRIDRLELSLSRAIKEILDDATEGTTRGVDSYAQQLAAHLREERLAK